MLILIERTTKFLLNFGKLHGQFLKALSGKYTSMLTSNLSKNFMIYSSSNANCYCVQTSHLNKRTRKILHITVLKIPYISCKCVLFLESHVPYSTVRKKRCLFFNVPVLLACESIQFFRL